MYEIRQHSPRNPTTSTTLTSHFPHHLSPSSQFISMDDQSHALTSHSDDSDSEWGNYPLLRHHSIRAALSCLPHRTILSHGNNNCSSLENRNGYYWKAVMVMDVVWNMALVVVGVVGMLGSLSERPSRPLRVWVCGYGSQCLLHIAFLLFPFNNTTLPHHHHTANRLAFSFFLPLTSFVKLLESFNTIISSIWWLMGFYWILAGGQVLMQDSPCLYWLTVVFLAFDVFFIMFCIGMACVIFLAIFCCIPILAIAYAVAVRKGASEEDIRSLPKYRYSEYGPLRTLGNKGEDEGNIANGRMLLPEDSDCCICLSRYVDGAELYSLPCNHHFHCGCISKWLRINATCPLCKFNICSGDTLV